MVETSAKAGAAIGSCEVLADAIARKDEDVAEVTAERDRLKAALVQAVAMLRPHYEDDYLQSKFSAALGDAS